MLAPKHLGLWGGKRGTLVQRAPVMRQALMNKKAISRLNRTHKPFIPTHPHLPNQRGKAHVILVVPFDTQLRQG